MLGTGCEEPFLIQHCPDYTSSCSIRHKVLFSLAEWNRTSSLAQASTQKGICKGLRVTSPSRGQSARVKTPCESGCLIACVSVRTSCVPIACRGQKRELISLNRAYKRLQRAVWRLKIRLLYSQFLKICSLCFS